MFPRWTKTNHAKSGPNIVYGLFIALVIDKWGTTALIKSSLSSFVTEPPLLDPWKKENQSLVLVLPEVQ